MIRKVIALTAYLALTSLSFAASGSAVLVISAEVKDNTNVTLATSSIVNLKPSIGGSVVIAKLNSISNSGTAFSVKARTSSESVMKIKGLNLSNKDQTVSYKPNANLSGDSLIKLDYPKIAKAEQFNDTIILSIEAE